MSSSSASVDERTPLILSDERREQQSEKEVPCRHIPARYVIVTLGFLATTILISLRASFSVAVVAMVNSTSSSTSEVDWDTNHSVIGGQERSVTPGDPQGQFQWDEATQGLILGAFYYGYFWPQMLFGQLAERVGGRVVMGLSVLSSAVLTLLIPLAAQTGAMVLVAVRVLQGFAEAGTFPACHTLLGLWSPLQERSRLANLTYLGVEIGTVVGMMTSGLLSEYGFAGGWPSIFYIHGTLGCACAVMWMCLIHDTPDKHPRITAREKALITHTVVRKEKTKTPWRHILTSPAVWAVAVLHFVVSWSFTAVMTMLPTYMSQVLRFDIEQNGFLSSIPFVAQLSMELVGSVALDLLHNLNITRHSRKIFNTVGAVLAAAFLIGTGYIPADSPGVAIALLTLAVGCGALCVCCMRVSHLDIAPRFGGTLYGLTNTVANISGFVAPMVAGFLTQNQQTVEQWRIFYCIIAGLYLAGALVFLLWGRGEVQEWAKDSSSSSSFTISTYSPLGSGEEGDGNTEKQNGWRRE